MRPSKVIKFKKDNEPWTVNEKTILLDALQHFGSSNVKRLAECVPGRSVTSTRNRIRAYKKLGRMAPKKMASDPCDDAVNRARVKTYQESCASPWPNADNLNKWLFAMGDGRHASALRTELPAAFRLIANLENHPEPSEFRNVDLKALYLHVADALEEIEPRHELNTESLHFLRHSVLELTAKLTADPAKLAPQLQFLEGITRLFPNIKAAEATIDTPIPNALSTILSSAAYNPLQVPDRLLDIKVDDTAINQPL